MAANLYTLQSSNIRRTWMLFIVFFIVFVGLGYFISVYYGDPSILVFAAIFCIVYSLISYYSSASIALWLARAKEIQKADNPML